MLPIRLRLKGIGPYVDEEIRFSDIPGGVIAIVGQNGSGKTMLMDAVFCALYRQFPYRDEVFKYCNGKDARIEFDFRLGGQDFLSVININAPKREMEPWLSRNGEVITDGKNGSFDAEIERLLGSASQALVSVYAAQGNKGSFTSLAKARRKELFISMRGLEKLQQISELAAKHEDALAAEFKSLDASIAVTRPLAEFDEAAVQAAHTKLSAVREDLNICSAERDRQFSVVEQIKGKLQAGSNRDRLAFATRRRDRIVSEKVTLLNRICSAKGIVGNIPLLRASAERYNALNSENEAIILETAKIRETIADHRRGQVEAEARYRELLGEADKRKAALKIAEDRHRRAVLDASLIDGVPCRAEGDCAECQFLKNALVARDSIDDLDAESGGAKAQLLAANETLKGCMIPAYGGLIANLELTIKTLDTKRAKVAQDMVYAREAENGLVKAQEYERELPSLEVKVIELDSELQAAESEVAQLSAAAAQEVGDVKRLREAEVLLSAATDNLRELTKLSAALEAAISGQDVARTKAMEAKLALNGLLDRRAKVEYDRQSWALLAKSFGKSGIQSLEIDVAGPEVSAIANDLLFSCFGPRFSIRFLTQVVKSDRSGYKDEFDIYVTDSQRGGREGSISDLSGGEKVIVGESLSLAIALFNSRAGTRWSSLWRDESSSAVDDIRAPQYIRMLRKARELGLFDKLYFVAHQPRATENADAQITVSDGKVTI